MYRAAANQSITCVCDLCTSLPDLPMQTQKQNLTASESSEALQVPFCEKRIGEAP